MQSEIIVLCLAAFLYVGQLFFTSRLQDRDMGHEYNVSPRDSEPRYSDLTERMQRALRNHLDNYVLFAVAVFAVILTQSTFWLTAVCAWVYLLARIAYVPAYYFGWVPWRSVFFILGLLPTILLFLAALF
ncbi:MAPEG family protein [Falsirhodobacter sp. alg1]|uniref:MAPEG family protein n=1 Tax=Falsirhodobacter sp. alg1 TaxID=1472418 RepID=UPI000787CCAE|nr:MAPEG family protein [Falsirhodobacter sp. alg1]